MLPIVTFGCGVIVGMVLTVGIVWLLIAHAANIISSEDGE